MSRLTDEQREQLEEIAYNVVLEVVENNKKFRGQVVESYVEDMSDESIAFAVGQDRADWPKHFPFHPLTGEAWEDTSHAGDCPYRNKGECTCWRQNVEA